MESMFCMEHQMMKGLRIENHKEALFCMACDSEEMEVNEADMIQKIMKDMMETRRKLIDDKEKGIIK
jgi:hypothetical protein